MFGHRLQMTVERSHCWLLVLRTGRTNRTTTQRVGWRHCWLALCEHRRTVLLCTRRKQMKTDCWEGVRLIMLMYGDEAEWRNTQHTCHDASCFWSLLAISLSAQCISSTRQIMSLTVSLSHKTRWTLYGLQSSTYLHQTCHQGRVPGDVVTHCFWCKSETFLSAKPEVELILTIAPIEKYL